MRCVCAEFQFCAHDLLRLNFSCGWICVGGFAVFGLLGFGPECGMDFFLFCGLRWCVMRWTLTDWVGVYS